MCLGSIGRIVRVWDEGGVPMAHVESGESGGPACLMYVPHAGVGSHVLVHTGFAIEVLSDEAAAEAVALRTGVGQ